MIRLVSATAVGGTLAVLWHMRMRRRAADAGMTLARADIETAISHLPYEARELAPSLLRAREHVNRAQAWLR